MLINPGTVFQEAEIENRIAEMKKEGFWSLKRLSKVPEPARPKVHWDYLCEEMQWLSADFAQERRWKRGVARKVGYHLFAGTIHQSPCLFLEPVFIRTLQILDLLDANAVASDCLVASARLESLPC